MKKEQKTIEKAARFALPILTQTAQIAPHGPKTPGETPKSAFYRVLAKAKFT